MSESKPTHEFVIDRAIWNRGDYFPRETRQLVNKHGHMCCLGIYLRSCGVPRRALHVGTPMRVRDLPAKALWLIDQTGVGPVDSSHASLLMEANDFAFYALLEGGDNRRSGWERERRIKQLFAKAGVTVRFVGRSPRRSPQRRRTRR